MLIQILDDDLDIYFFKTKISIANYFHSNHYLIPLRKHFVEYLLGQGVL